MSFVRHTLESAPEGARPTMAAIEKQFGYLPVAVASMATSPQLLLAFVRANALFTDSSLTEIEREILVMTVATHNECDVCTALHTAHLTSIRAPAGLISALRNREPLTSERWEALRSFVLEVLESAGGVSDSALTAFLEDGFTERNALDVVLGVGTYTLSTFANRLTQTPVDPQLTSYSL